MIVSVKESPHGLIVVVTDKMIMGNVYSEGKVRLDFTKDFYQGKEESAEKIKELMREARHLHLSGKQAVNLGIELNLVDKNKILRVKCIPHAEVVVGG